MMDLIGIFAVIGVFYAALFLVGSFIPPINWILRKIVGSDFLDKSQAATYIALIISSSYLSYLFFSWLGLAITGLIVLFIQAVKVAPPGEKINTSIAFLVFYAITYGVYYYFDWMGIIILAITLITIGIIYGLIQAKNKQKVVSYFLAREMGSIPDVAGYTSLDESDCASIVQTLLEEGSLALLIDAAPPVYRWALKHDFTEGVISNEISLD